jgi:para-nitrobenzyl esterase
MREAAVWLIQKNCGFYPASSPRPRFGRPAAEKPWDALIKGSAQGVDVIFGTNRDESTLFTSGKMFPHNWALTEKMLQLNGYKDRLPEFKKVYGGMKEKEAANAMMTDRAFWVDYVRCADAQAAHGKVFAYRFDFVHTALRLLGFGAMHGSEVNHMLNTSGGLGGMISIPHQKSG